MGLIISRLNTLPTDVTNISVGSRIILPNGKEYILNKLKVWIPIHMMALEVKEDLINEDLNTIDKFGIYHQNSNNNALLSKNYPVQSAGVLKVYVNNGNVFQEYQVLGGQIDENKIFTRGKYAGYWSNWLKPNYVNINESDYNSLLSNKHTHNNKSLLDSYTQTNENLLDAVNKKHLHSNINELNSINSTKINNWDIAYSWGNHNSFNYLTQTSGDIRYLKNTGNNNLNGDITIIDTINEDTNYFVSGASNLYLSYNGINLSKFGFYSNLISNTINNYWFGIKDYSFLNGNIEIKFFEYDEVLNRWTLGKDVSLYLNTLNLGTVNQNKILTLDNAGKIGYIDGIPVLKSGTGTINYLTKFSENGTISDSQIFEDGTYVRIKKQLITGYGLTNVDNFISIANTGVGYATGFKFDKSSDGAGLSVTEVVSDSTMYEFFMSDNPDGGDMMQMRFTDWQSANTMTVPIWTSGKDNRFIGKQNSFYGSINQSTNGIFTTSNFGATNGSQNQLQINQTSKLRIVGSSVNITNLNINDYNGEHNHPIWIKLDSATTFAWGTGSHTGTAVQSGIALSTSAITLSNGIKVTFSATTGTVGDLFTFRAIGKPTNYFGTTNFDGNITATSFIKSGGTSEQFLKADGSVDNRYFTEAIYVTNTPINKKGTWMSMTDSSGISGWTHVINLDWDKNDTNKNWSAQIAVNTQSDSGMYYRSSNGVENITNKSWKKLAESSEGVMSNNYYPYWNDTSKRFENGKIIGVNNTVYVNAVSPTTDAAFVVNGGTGTSEVSIKTNTANPVITFNRWTGVNGMYDKWYIGQGNFIENGFNFSAADLVIAKGASTNLGDNSVKTPMFFIQYNGNVGIAITNRLATEKLDVNGYVKATGFKTPSGTSEQFLKANGSVDNTTYINAIGGNRVLPNWYITSPYEGMFSFISDDYPALIWGQSTAYMSDEGMFYLDSTGINQTDTNSANYFSGEVNIYNYLNIGKGLTINGSLNSGATNFAGYRQGGDNIVLKGNSTGVSGIFFQSEEDGTNINHPSDYGYIQFHAHGIDSTSGESNKLVIGVANDADDMVILQSPYKNGVKISYLNGTGGTGGTAYTVWHQGNHGAGSGLDADLLDGQESTYFLDTSSNPQTKSGSLTIGGTLTATGFKTPSGIPSQFLKANGSVDSNTYTKTDGTNATGTWGINITGNAATATTATTTTGNAATTTKLQTARTLTIGATGKTFDGSGNQTWTLSEIGAANASQLTAGVTQSNFDTIKPPGLYQYDGTLNSTPNGHANYRSIELGSAGRYSQIALPWDEDGMWFRKQRDSTWGTWREVLHSGNYNSFAPTLTGTGATGTWGISITGNANTSTRVTFTDGPRNLSDRLPNNFGRSVLFDFVEAGIVGGAGSYAGVMTFNPWEGTTASTGDSSYQLAFYNQTGVNGSGIPGLKIRKGIDTTWNIWYKIYTTGDFTQSNIDNWNTAFGWGSHVAAWNAASLSYSGSTLTLTINGIPKTVTINAGTNYNLPTANANTLGGVKLFSDTVQSVASNAVTTTASRTYGVQLNSSGQMVVNVPWVDTNTNTTYSAGNGLTLTGTVFSLPITVSGSGNYITDVTQTTNGITVTKGTLPTYNLPTASATTLGGVKIGSGITITNGVISANTYTAGTNITISSNQISVVASPTFSGSVTATAFYESSLRELKENIQHFEKSGLELVNSLEIVTFDKKDGSAKDKIGIIADDSPEEFLSDELNAVDLYKTVFIQAKAIQELKSEVDELRELIKQLIKKNK